MNEGATAGLNKLESAGYAEGTTITSVAGDGSTVLPATASLGDSAAGSFNQLSVGSHRSSGSPGRPAAIYPRVVTAMDIIEDSDADSVFCGPASDTEQSGLSELRALHAWGIGVQEEDGHRRRRRGGEEAWGIGVQEEDGHRRRRRGGEEVGVRALQLEFVH
eukprot:TRINITY_DN1248_c0_g1_i4.p2 TRINITY_DN1248_c0_g1~~TRINITY_DN1248_c0_g1_i4.p2  ORF type:complete len:162 (-),score=27.96 TRINITY_DN1248_c0_g1_i4:75-560(-)